MAGSEIKQKCFWPKAGKGVVHALFCAYASFRNEASGNDNNSHQTDLLWLPLLIQALFTKSAALDVISRFDYLKLLF